MPSILLEKSGEIAQERMKRLSQSKTKQTNKQQQQKKKTPSCGEIEWFHEDLQDLLALTPKKDGLFIIGNMNAKVGSKQISQVTGKFGLGVQNEGGQRLTVLPRVCTSQITRHLSIIQQMTLHMDITR